jgi:hypothetical protein
MLTRDGTMAAMTTDRPNTQLATAVDQALAMADKRDAARHLEKQGASFALTCRVLLDPARRRVVMTPEQATLQQLGHSLSA